MQVAIQDHHNHVAQLHGMESIKNLGMVLSFPTDIRTCCVAETVKKINGS